MNFKNPVIINNNYPPPFVKQNSIDPNIRSVGDYRWSKNDFLGSGAFGQVF